MLILLIKDSQVTGQVSFPLMNEPQLSTLAKVRATQAFPILWFEETTEVTNEDKILYEIQNVEMK